MGYTMQDVATKHEEKYWESQLLPLLRYLLYELSSYEKVLAELSSYEKVSSDAKFHS